MAIDLEGFGIYQIVAPSGSRYVGMTMDSFSKRWYGHKKELVSGRHKSAGLKRAYSKYGLSQLRFEILETSSVNADVSTVRTQEQKWWDILKSQGCNLYNGRPTGTGSVSHTDEAKHNISLSVLAIGSEEVEVRACKKCGKMLSITRLSKRKIYCNSSCYPSNLHRQKSKNQLINGIPPISKNELTRLYWEEQKSAKEISLLFNCTAQTVRNWMHLLGITRRENKANAARIMNRS